MDIAETIFGRRSTREYHDRVPGEGLLRSIIEAAIQAPSAVNEQPWTFTVVRDQAVLDQLSHDAKAYMLASMSASLAGAAHTEHFRVMLGNPEFQIFYHAPALVVISGNTPGSYVVEDCALAAQNLMLRACSLGLGSCWIGFVQSYLGTHAGKQTLGIPETWVPVAPIIVGYPRAPAAAVPRRAAEVRWIG